MDNPAWLRSRSERVQPLDAQSAEPVELVLASDIGTQRDRAAARGDTPEAAPRLLDREHPIREPAIRFDQPGGQRRRVGLDARRAELDGTADSRDLGLERD